MDHQFLDNITLPSQAAAERAAMVAIRRSMWFSIEPLPDDCWEILFKDEPGNRKAIITAGKA